MLRPATEAERDLILTWRNQTANREASINQGIIQPEEHRRWWSKAVDDPSKRILLFEVDGKPLGVVNFFDLDLDSSPKTGGWGFYLDNETATSSGFSFLLWGKIVSEAIAYAFDTLGLDRLEGEVLAGNEAARSMNRRHNLTESEPIVYETQTGPIEVIPVSLESEDRRSVRSNSA